MFENVSALIHSRLCLQELGLTGTQLVTVNVRKTIQSSAGDVVFTFACDGNPCSNRTVALSHLSFDKTADFTDTTTVAVQGVITIAGTKEFNGSGSACPIEKANVCARNHYGANEQIVCRESDINGRLPHPVGGGYHVSCAF
jgi:hypothetical protein